MSSRITIVWRSKQEKLKSVINLYNVQTFAFGLKRYLCKDKGMDKAILLLSLFASQQFTSTWTAFLWAVSSLCYHACHNRLSSYFPNTFRSELIKSPLFEWILETLIFFLKSIKYFVNILAMKKKDVSNIIVLLLFLLTLLSMWVETFTGSLQIFSTMHEKMQISLKWLKYRLKLIISSFKYYFHTVTMVSKLKKYKKIH